MKFSYRSTQHLIRLLFTCLQRCLFESDGINDDDKASDEARKKLICAAILSVVFMVKFTRINQSRINHLISCLVKGYRADRGLFGWQFSNHE